MALQNIKTKPTKVNNIETVYNTRKVNTGTSENPTYKYNVQLPATDASQVYYDYNSIYVHPVKNQDGSIYDQYKTEFGDNSGSILSLKTVIDNIISKIGKKESSIGYNGTFSEGNINARIKWLYDHRVNIDDIGTFWKYIGQIDSLKDGHGKGILGENDSTHPTQIKKSIKVSEGHKSPLDENQLKLLSIPDTEVITLSNPSGSVKWKELKVGSVIHVENIKPDDTTKIHSEYVLISKSGPRESMEYELNGGTIYNYYFDFVWTEFGPDLSGYAKTSVTDDISSRLNTIETGSGVENAKTATYLTTDKAFELTVDSGIKGGEDGTTPITNKTTVTLQFQETHAPNVTYGKGTITLPDSGVTAGPYSCVSVNSKGIVTKGQQFIAYATNLTGISNLSVGGLAIVESLE